MNDDPRKLKDPYTCRHKLGKVDYTMNGSQCRDCGRKWYVWTTSEGHKMLLTEPRYAKKKQDPK